MKGKTVKKRVWLFAVAVGGVERLTGAMQSKGNCGDRERRPVSFPEWKSALSGVENELQETYRREVVSFLHHCKKLHAPATIALARSYLQDRERTHRGPAREGLRWFFRTASLAGKAHWSPSSAPEHSKPDRTPAQTSGNAPAGSRPTFRPAPVDRGAHNSEPVKAADDLGGPAWEKALITAVRAAGLLWRTEPRIGFATRSS